MGSALGSNMLNRTQAGPAVPGKMDERIHETFVRSGVQLTIKFDHI